jgi:hypothetical protein
MDAEDIGRFALLLLQEPLLLLELLFLAGVLIAAWGRAFGVPLMFWNDSPSTQFFAGLASNLVAAHIFLVAYLAGNSVQQLEPRTYAVMAAVVWSLVQVVAILLQMRAPSPSSQYSVAPRIREVVTRDKSRSGLGQLKASGRRPWGFLGGLLGATALIGVVGYCTPRIAAVEPLTQIVQTCARVAAPVTGMTQVDHPELHLLSAGLVLLGVVGFFWLRFTRVRVPAVVGVCGLLSFVAANVGAFSFWLRSHGAAVVLVLPLLWFAGSQRYKVRLADLADLYRAPEPYPPLKMSVPAMDLRADWLSCTASKPEFPGPTTYGSTKKVPLILVTTSGGGIRAAAWTTALLGKLDAIDGFRHHTWMITGASGGMVGAAAWVAAIRARPAGISPKEWKRVFDAVGADSLAPTAQALVFGDLPQAVLPFSNRNDRGTKLQGAWVRNVAGLKVRLDETLADLREGEQKGLYPSLVFSPMIVEDGRRLLLSNLTLAPAVSNRTTWLDPGGTIGGGVASVSAYHGRDILGAGFEKMTLATAARLSASFPFVSPAAHLPTTPPRRVVDAGYYDNYGLDLACSWLEQCIYARRDWIRDHISGVLVIQIRDSELSATMGGTPPDDGLPPPAPGASTGNLARAFQGLTSPPEGVLAARQSVMMFRNDAQLQAIASLYRTYLKKDFVATSIFELKADVSLSWTLSDGERSMIGEQAEAEGIQQKIDDIRDWMASRVESAPERPDRPAREPAGRQPLGELTEG